jgi:discoidin domain receptor family protein 2
VLLPSDIRREFVTSITAVLLPFCYLFADSPSYREDDVTYACCRLRHDKNGGAWCPKHMVTREALEYLEVNLHTMHVVVAVQTQGRFGNGMGQEYAEQYMLEYWRPSFSSNMWARWKDRSGKEVSTGHQHSLFSCPSHIRLCRGTRTK